MFQRYADRIYVEDAADIAAARVAFVARAGEQRQQLDPLAELGSGCLVAFPASDDVSGLFARVISSVDADATLRFSWSPLWGRRDPGAGESGR
jgi:hypothetical protein